MKKHWYLLTFLVYCDEGKFPASMIIHLNEQIFTQKDIKRFVDAVKADTEKTSLTVKSVFLTNQMYLGHMTEETFTS